MTIREEHVVVEDYTPISERVRNSSNVGITLLALLVVVAVAITAFFFVQSSRDSQNRLMQQETQSRLLDQLAKPAEVQPAPQVIQTPPQVIQVPVPHEVKVPTPVDVPTPTPAAQPAQPAQPAPQPAQPSEPAPQTEPAH